MDKVCDPLLQALGRKISRHRKLKKISMGELAQKMAISKGNLSDIEAGKRDPRYTTLKAIAEGMGVTIAELIGAQGARGAGSKIMAKPPIGKRAKNRPRVIL